MQFSSYKFFIVAVLFLMFGIACSKGDAQKNTAPAGDPVSKPAVQTTPSNKFTPADIAKLKWIEGTWRGMDGDKPFYERYKVEESAMVVETLKEDGSLDGEPGRFELKDGEFGKTEGKARSVASEITDTYVQFVPGVGTKGNNFRFEKQPHGWDAILEWTAADGTAKRKVYKMEPWQPKK